MANRPFISGTMQVDGDGTSNTLAFNLYQAPLLLTTGIHLGVGAPFYGGSLPLPSSMDIASGSLVATAVSIDQWGNVNAVLSASMGTGAHSFEITCYF